MAVRIPSARYLSRPVLAALVLTTATALLLTLHSTGAYPEKFKTLNHNNGAWGGPTTAKDFASEPYCLSLRDPGNIAIVIKTGATEAHARLPDLLETSLRCVSDPLIFSDLAQQINGYKVHDVLSNMTPQVMAYNTDFDLYRMQKEYVATGREADIPKLVDVPDSAFAGRSAAWKLDKYKFLHMIERSWELQPERDWYLFIDADTYVNWPNLLRWTSLLDPTRRLYLGYQIRFWQHPWNLDFAHGGAGILLSGAAVREFAGKGIANQWDARLTKYMLGDAALAAALLEELDVRMTYADTSMTGMDPPRTLFREALWCQPLVTMHKFNSTYYRQAYEYDRENGASHAMRFGDMYLQHFSEGMPKKRINWLNMMRDDDSFAPDWTLEMEQGDEESEDPHSSFDACQRACLSNEQCFQFAFSNSIRRNTKREKRCHLSAVFRLGKEKPVSIDDVTDSKFAGQMWTSGWMTERITEWVKGHLECPADENVIWPGVKR